MVLEACPDIVPYARFGISSWADFVATARTVRGALSISPDAWEQACAALGEAEAAITVAAILQRGQAIRNPGGYMRSLTEKAREGQFSLGPVLMALLNTGLRARLGRGQERSTSPRRTTAPVGTSLGLERRRR